MLMQALRPWLNVQHEGRIEVGDQFECQPLRARELEALGLAIPIVSHIEKIRVMADPVDMAIADHPVETATEEQPRVEVATKVRRAAR